MISKSVYLVSVDIGSLPICVCYSLVELNTFLNDRGVKIDPCDFARLTWIGEFRVSIFNIKRIAFLVDDKVGIV